MAAQDDTADDADEPAKRRYCTLAVKTLVRLEKLKKRGTHGTSVARIMTAMIEAGVRDAHKAGYLSDDDML